MIFSKDVLHIKDLLLITIQKFALFSVFIGSFRCVRHKTLYLLLLPIPECDEHDLKEILFTFDRFPVMHRAHDLHVPPSKPRDSRRVFRADKTAIENLHATG